MIDIREHLGTVCLLFEAPLFATQYLVSLFSIPQLINNFFVQVLLILT